MIEFPNCKINIGLSISGKRDDGYHNIESVMMPIPWCEAIEVNQTTHVTEWGNANRKTVVDDATLFEYGIQIPGNPENNLCVKVFQLLGRWYKLPKTSIHVLKKLPIGAGLGAGSADAAFCLKALTKHYHLKVSDKEARQLLSEIGSDCPFFWRNKPAFVFGTGTQEREIELDLSDKHILIVYPKIKISTSEAYSGVVPSSPQIDLSSIDSIPIESWRECITNDFEKSIFPKYPLLQELKNEMYSLGAIYASMSGSGSAIYGIFDEHPKTSAMFNSFEIFAGKT